MLLSYGNSKIFILLLLSVLLIIALSITTTIAENIKFNSVDEEDYAETAESSKPDDVDNEAINELVQKFLDKGTLEDAPGTKVNLEASKLINSSNYWNPKFLEGKTNLKDVEELRQWLTGYAIELEKVLHQVALAAWNYFTSASITTKQFLDEAEEVAQLFLKASAKQSHAFNAENFDGLERQQLELIVKEGMNALEGNDLNSYNNILTNVNYVFTSLTVCQFGAPDGAPCFLKFTDLWQTFQDSKNPNETLSWWKTWRQTAGLNLTKTYEEFVVLANKAARMNGYTDAGAMWRSAFETPTTLNIGEKNDKLNNNKIFYNISAEIDSVYEQIQPLYKQLHAYFRPRLASVYGGQNTGVSKDGPLPVHLLKSLSGENWIGHYEETRPFSETNELLNMEIQENLHSQNKTVRTMYTKIYRYMKHLGFSKLPLSFWSKSIFTRNWSKDMICHPATAYEMYDKSDYRIKSCAQLSENDFINAHKLFAQLYYKFESQSQPLLLRDAPNPSLSQALAGAFGILALNTDYLKAQELITDKTERSESTEINRLYKEALENLVNIPFSIVADKWRYQVFEGKLNKDNWSEAWWNLRNIYQGVAAPLNQTDDLSKFDSIASPIIMQQNAPATRNLVSYVAQFQILKHICSESLTNATNYQLSQGCFPKKMALEKMIKIMQKGSTISWLEAFETLTGSKKLDATALLEYYEPLFEWLTNSNKHEQLIIGWEINSGIEFQRDELPEIRQLSDNSDQFAPPPGANGEANFAFPGGFCAKGQECLLDSECNGTICVCRKGLFTLKFDDSYNCVQSDPAKAGFTDEEGGVIIALNPTIKSEAKSEAIETKLSFANSSDFEAMDTVSTKPKGNSALTINYSIIMQFVIIFGVRIFGAKIFI